MYPQDKLDAFVASYGFKPRNVKSELKHLPQILHPEEELSGLLEGILKKVHTRAMNGIGMVIATDRRIIFFRKSIIGTITKEEIPIEKVSSASHRKGLLTSSIAITTSSNDAIIEGCNNKEAAVFNDAVQKLISKLSQKASAPAVAPALSNVEQLERLFELKQKGIITDEEFTAQKAKLMA